MNHRQRRFGTQLSMRTNKSLSVYKILPLMYWIASLLTLVLANSPSGQEQEGLVTLHGSGASVPQKCYWNVMEKLRAQSRQPIHMSYRAIGSSSGQAEFINNNNTNASASDFGSGDIPLSSAKYRSLHEAGVEVLHFPVLVDAMSFFHSVRGVDRLQLSPCLLARIFTRNITTWDHPDIVAENPVLGRSDLVLAAAYDSSFRNITIARRAEGSGTTNAITAFMNQACPEYFPAEMVGTLPAWPYETLACSGSDGIVKCIQEHASAIGYVILGHGITAHLKEVAIPNAYGTIQTASESLLQSGISAAAEGYSWPESPLDDFGAVNLLNGAGQFTWPIVEITYLYIRKDLSFVSNPQQQALMVAFLKALYDPTYVQVCVDQYDFLLPSARVQQIGQQAIALLEQAANQSGAEPWVFETDKAMPITGMGKYVISVKRQEISDVERATLISDVNLLEATVADLLAALNTSAVTISELQDDVAALKKSLTQVTSGQSLAASESSGLSSKDQKQLHIAFILASMSFGFSVSILFVAAAKISCSKKGAKH